MFEAPLADDSEEIVKHRAANAQATDMLSRMHRLQLRVLIIKPLERADRDQLPAAADTEEGDGGIEQAIDLERVRILWRAVQTPELQMMLDELSHLIDPWISDRDVELIHQHAARLTARLAATAGPLRRLFARPGQEQPVTADQVRCNGRAVFPRFRGEFDLSRASASLTISCSASSGRGAPQRPVNRGRVTFVSALFRAEDFQ